MTTDTGREQRLSVNIHLLHPPPRDSWHVVTFDAGHPPIATVRLLDGLTLQADSVDVLRGLSDAFEEAARALQTAALEQEATA